MKILITGIHGFVGSNLVNALKGKHILYGLDIVAPEKDGVVKTYSWDDLGKRRWGLSVVLPLFIWRGRRMIRRINLRRRFILISIQG